MLVHTNLILTTVLTDLIDTGNALDAASIGLFKDGNVLGPGSVLADVEVADFDGYAASLIAEWLGPAPRDGGLPYVITDDAVFTADDPIVTTNIIGGWYLFKGTELLAFAEFPSPLIVDRPGQLIMVRAEFGPGSNVPVETQVVSP